MGEQDSRPAPIEIEAQDGLVLRQLISKDAQNYFDLIEYDRTHLSRHDEDTAIKYPTLESVQESIDNPKNPDRLRFGIWDGETMVGSINLTLDIQHSAEIGYWVGKEYIGHSYATKAIRALIP